MRREKSGGARRHTREMLKATIITAAGQRKAKKGREQTPPRSERRHQRDPANSARASALPRQAMAIRRRRGVGGARLNRLWHSPLNPGMSRAPPETMESARLQAWTTKKGKNGDEGRRDGGCRRPRNTAWEVSELVQERGSGRCIFGARPRSAACALRVQAGGAPLSYPPSGGMLRA